MAGRGVREHLGALVGYTAVGLAFAWPLPRQLGTALTGSPDGDTGVYVWNQWVFQHEVLVHQKLPYFTGSILSPGPEANLGLHNYTVFQDLLALPLSPILGVVATFNVVLLFVSVLTAYSTFLLARHVTRRWTEAWLAGLIFAWSPILVTRGFGHFSLVAAAPLAIFLLVLMKAAGRERLRHAAALGVVLAWAGYSDVYYAVYCLLIGAAFFASRVCAIRVDRQVGFTTLGRRTIDALLFLVAGLVATIAMTGGFSLTLLGLSVSARGLYTPVLVLTMLALLRVPWRLRVSVEPTGRMDAWRLVRLGAVVALVATALLSPVLYAVGLRMTAGGFNAPAVFWRTGPGGVDLVAAVVPNPNHALAPAWIHDWLTSLRNGYVENVVSIPLVAALTMLMAWRLGWRAPRWWVALALGFGVLALGPFVHVAGVNTYVPGPWALLRYVPIVGLARMPGRFSVVMFLAVAVLCATALEWIGRKYPERRRPMLVIVAVLLLAELVPAPLTLHSAAVPRVYQQVAAAPGEVRVLDLPTGIRDGTTSVGNFSPLSLFFQTRHGKPIIGGYLSRVADDRVAALRRNDVIDGLIVLSEGGTLSAPREAGLIAGGPAFVRAANLGFVVVDRTRASPALADFAVRALRLELVEADGPLTLYRPTR